jgi:hypothetical protein
MKRIVLILSFFVLTFFVKGQDKMGFGNMPEGVDSAGVGTVTTWVKKTVPSGGQFVMKTSDTSSAFEFNPSLNFTVINSGATLHWEVTGAVTASYDGNYPTFDFSAPGEKIITVTSADNLVNLTDLFIFDLSITSLDVSNLVNLTGLFLYNLSITSLDVSNLVNLTYFYFINLPITSLELNNILDQLIAIGNSGSYAEVSPTCADASKISALDAIWDDVYITPCN